MVNMNVKMHLAHVEKQYVNAIWLLLSLPGKVSFSLFFFRNSDMGHIISVILYVPYYMYHVICITSYGPYDKGHIHWRSSLFLKNTSDAAEWNTKYWAMDMGGYQHFNTTQCIEPTGGNYKARCCANTLSGSFSKLILSHNVFGYRLCYRDIGWSNIVGDN